MPFAVVLTMYVAMLLYAALAFFLGELVPLATIALGFGLLLIPYYALEWVATPAVAAIMGFQSRWGVAAALIFGIPLVVLFTAITPVVSSGSPSLAVPVPWLSVYAATKTKVIPLIFERLTWWGVLYLGALLAGLASRRIRPIAASTQNTANPSFQRTASGGR